MFTSRKASSFQVIWCATISYILKAICSFVHIYLYANVVFTWNARVIILSVLASILSIVLVIISELKIVNKIILNINHKSIHNDIWNDVVDYRNGTSLMFVCNNGNVITGVLEGHEEKGNESWFILREYVINCEDAIRSSKDMIKGNIGDCKIAVNLKNVDRIELFYGTEKDFWFLKIKKSVKSLLSGLNGRSQSEDKNVDNKLKHDKV